MKLIAGIVVAWLIIEWFINWAGGPIISLVLFIMVGAIALAAKSHKA
jgi:hypothetical protein